MQRTLLINARVFDGYSADCPEGMQVLVEDDLIREISAKPIKAPEARVLDLAGRTLMPGLIDAHIHAYASDVSVQKIDLAGDPYRTAHAMRMLGFALDCGFTALRDIGGGDYSLWRAIQDKLIRAPRFFYAGKVISMTGGHGDMRQMSERHHTQGYCSCGDFNSLSVIADGVDEVLKATREELRRGAHCIKIMGSGGVASPTDPIWMNQYREDEIRAIVNETMERRTYTAAHCHPASAVRRCVEFGVRSIEHGTLIDDETARFVAEKGAFVVPTMVIIFALVELGRRLGFPPQSQEKAEFAYKQALSGMESMRRAGVRIGFGTDLLGETYVQQCREFTIRREVFTPLEILRQVTSTNAALLQHEGKLGCVKEGALADLIVVDGDPLEDIELLAAQGRNLRVIMRAGELVKNELH
ncbi:MAG TPA: amidohydrolase family protein [Steroidobacteraceae bacterium]|nr:amidohydrolase family protein [Steroidobacteraceae bacterium]